MDKETILSPALRGQQAVACQSSPVERCPSLWDDAWVRLRRNRAAVAAIGVIIAILILAVFADWLAPYHYATQDLANTWGRPSLEHLMGTDGLGRDIMSRLIYGTRVSVSVAITADIIILFIGVPLGLLAGYSRGWKDGLIMRFVDVMYAFPDLLLVIIIMTFVKGNLSQSSSPMLQPLVTINAASGGLLGVFIALGLTSWLTVCRMVRSQALTLREREFVEAARSVGANESRIVRSHILPNILGLIVVAAAFTMPRAIMLEAALSYLGLGVDPPMASWGSMIADGVPAMRSYPYMVIAPALVLAISLLAFNFLGDGLRDALDPSLRQ
jgi:oligopeptide transport system permease protein